MLPFSRRVEEMDYLLQIPDPVPADLEYVVPELLHLEKQIQKIIEWKDI